MNTGKREVMASNQRKYRITDTVLLTHATHVATHFEKYADKFMDFNEVKYGETFFDSLTELIQKAQTLVSESEKALSQKALTAEIKKSVKELISALQLLRVHVMDTYEDNPTKIQEFNLNRITVHSPNTDTFITYCKQVLGTIALHCKELIRNGLKEDILDNTLLKLEYLNNLQSQKMKSKMSRAIATENRITVLNQLFMTLKKMRDAAVYIFPDSPEVAKLFELPKNTYGKKTKANPPQEENE